LMIGAFQVDSTKDSILCNCLHESLFLAKGKRLVE
ncbi:hypothetical protein T02_12872, partial [Trichinella nativa]